MNDAKKVGWKTAWLAWGASFGLTLTLLEFLFRFVETHNKLSQADFSWGGWLMVCALASLPVMFFALLAAVIGKFRGRRDVDALCFKRGVIISKALGVLSLAALYGLLFRSGFQQPLLACFGLFVLFTSKMWARTVPLSLAKGMAYFPFVFALLSTSIAYFAWPTDGLGSPPIQVQARALDADTQGARDVLLITMDTTRADHLGVYGYDRAQTPTMDALGREGVVFEQAQSPMPITQPSHSSILTGRDAPFHGIIINGLNRLSSRTRSIATDFSDAGWHSSAVMSSYVLNRRYGLEQGFSWYDDQVPGQGVLEFVPKKFVEKLIVRSLGSRFLFLFGMDVRRFVGATLMPMRSATETIEASLHAIAQAPDDAPLFLWVHVWEPHAPYNPPEEFLPHYPREPGYVGEPATYWWGTVQDSVELIERYDGCLSYFDSELPRLLDAVRKRGRRPIIALTADHGEGLLEHGEATHGVPAWQTTMHVPLMIAGEGIPAGVRVSEPVTSYDLAPTLLSLAGLPNEREMEAMSLIPYWNGATPQRMIPGMGSQVNIKKPRWVIWRKNNWKLIWLEGGEEGNERLFNLQTDPGELNDMSAQKPELAAQLLAELKAFRASLPEVNQAETLEVSGFANQQLNALGYVDDDDDGHGH